MKFLIEPTSAWRKRMWMIALTCAGFFTVNQAAAQPLSLAQAIDKTLQQHPSLQVFPLREQGLAGERYSAGLNPELMLAAEIENVSGTRAMRGIEAMETTVALSSVLELGEKRQARLAVVDEKSQQLNVERELQSLDLMGEVARQFTQVLAAQARLALAKEALNLNRDIAAAVNKRVNAAIAPIADRGRAEASVLQAEITVTAIEQNLNVARMSLANLWGSLQPDYETVIGSLFQFEPSLAFDTLFHRVQLNPALQLFAAETRLREAELRLARSQTITDVGWSLGIRRNEDTDSAGLVAGLSVPLFSGQRASGQIESALAAKNAVAFQREAALLRLHSQLYQAYTEREQAIQTVSQLQQALIPTLNRSLEQTENAYERGLYSYLDLASARQELLQAKQLLIDAAELAVRYGIEIEQLTAEPLVVRNHTAQPD